MNLKELAFYGRRAAAWAIFGSMRVRNYVLGAFDRRRRFYAEFFTDRYIRNTFFPDFAYRGCVVEVGCATPELLSMSQHFRESGWRCIGIEPNPRFAALHRARGNEILEYAAADFESDDHEFVVAESVSNYSDHHVSAHSFSSLSIKPEYRAYKGEMLRHFKQTTIRVHVRRLDDILRLCQDLPNIDLLTIDVEGYELEVMRGFTPVRFGTRVIVLENLFHNPAYTDYMTSVGYMLHKAIAYNYIYIPEAVAC